MKKFFGKEYVSEKEASQRYGYSKSWFEKARFNKVSPPFMRFKQNGKVWYPTTETDTWFKSRMVMND